MEWREHLTDEERERLVEINRERDNLTAEYRRIYDRCRKRSQKALGGVEFTTGKGEAFIVDEGDAEKVARHKWQSVGNHTGKVARSSYIATKMNGKQVLLHRWLMNAPANLCVDHIDGDPHNNCRANLRLVTHGDNVRHSRDHMMNGGVATTGRFTEDFKPVHFENDLTALSH